MPSSQPARTCSDVQKDAAVAAQSGRSNADGSLFICSGALCSSLLHQLDLIHVRRSLTRCRIEQDEGRPHGVLRAIAVLYSTERAVAVGVFCFDFAVTCGRRGKRKEDRNNDDKLILELRQNRVSALRKRRLSARLLKGEPQPYLSRAEEHTFCERTRKKRVERGVGLEAARARQDQLQREESFLPAGMSA